MRGPHRRLATLAALAAVGFIILASLPYPVSGQPDAAVYGLSKRLNMRAGSHQVETFDAATTPFGHWKKYDALVLTPDDLEAIEARPGGASFLRQFVASHHGVAVLGADAASRLGLATVGADAPISDAGALAENRGTLYAVRDDASIATFTAAYATSERRAERFVDDALEFFESLPSAPAAVSGTARAHAAHWTLKLTASYCYELEPYGKLCYTGSFYQMNADGSSSYDWWNAVFEQTTVPGYDLYWNDWRTDTTWLTSDVNYYNPSTHQLVDWGPLDATVTGPGTFAYTTGMRAGQWGASVTDTVSQSYYAEDMSVAQASNTQYSDVYARHDFGYGSGPTTYTFSTLPGFTVRTVQGQCLYVPYTNKVEWREYTWNYQDNFYNTWINSWRQIC